MSRPYQPNELFVHEDDSGASYVNQTVLVPKGRYLLVPAPDTCPTCDGTKDGGHYGVGCEQCGGRGYAWPDKLWQNLEWVLTANAPLMSQRMKDAIVVGLLDALVEVDDEV